MKCDLADNYANETLLHALCKRGDHRSVSWLIGGGHFPKESIDHVNKEGEPALFLAIRGKSKAHCDIVEYLVANGADVNYVNGKTHRPAESALTVTMDCDNIEG